MGKILTVYFSRSGQNYVGGFVRDLSRGNTEIVAEMIQRAVGGDLFRVEPVKTYPDNYTACTEVARAELRAHERVEAKKYPDVSGYDTIFVGYPNWWGTLPMVMWTVLEHCDLTGKTVIPFCTNEGGGMGGSERDLRELCRGASVLRGLSIRGSQAAASESHVASWARKHV